jgi:hypothetical protein
MGISNPKSLLETGSVVLQEPYPIESVHSGELTMVMVILETIRRLWLRCSGRILLTSSE